MIATAISATSRPYSTAEAPRSFFLADASRRTTTLNAYVSGFGSTRRVVVYDNLVNDLPRDEARVFIAHELGHT
jgi:Zn-dependent protease with chaperone function